MPLRDPRAPLDGPEAIAARFTELQRQIDNLSSPSKLAAAARKRKHQVMSYTLGALGLGGSLTTNVVWPVAFADNDYIVTVNITNANGTTPSRVFRAYAPTTKTATGVSVTITNPDMVLDAGAILTVEGTHL